MRRNVKRVASAVGEDRLPSRLFISVLRSRGPRPHPNERRRACMAKRLIDVDTILNQAKAAHPSARARNPAIRTPGQAADCVVRERVQRERGQSQSAPRRHDDVARPVQETPLAGGRTDVLSAAPAVRQTLRGAERAGGQDCGTHPAPRRRQPGDGARRGGDDADSASAERPRRGSGPDLAPAARTRDRAERARTMARLAAEGGDDGTNDLVVAT